MFGKLCGKICCVLFFVLKKNAGFVYVLFAKRIYIRFANKTWTMFKLSTQTTDVRTESILTRWNLTIKGLITYKMTTDTATHYITNDIVYQKQHKDLEV